MGAPPAISVTVLTPVTSSSRHGKWGAPFHPGALGFGAQGEARVSLTTLSMEVEATRVETVAIVTRAQGADR